MTAYLQQILDNKYADICTLKQAMLYAPTAEQRESYKRGFLLKCHEVEDLAREINAREHRGAHRIRGERASVVKVINVVDTEKRIQDIREYL